MTDTLDISFDDFTTHIGKIIRNITVSNWRPDYIVGITRGGLMPAVMLSHYFDVPMHTLDVSFRDNQAGMGPVSNLWMSDDAFGYVPDEDSTVRSSDAYRKNILIVDDINDQGTTLNWIMDDWRSNCLPDNENWETVWNRNVRFAVIVDNLASLCKVKMDYVGVEINKKEKPVWINFPYENFWMK
jgi:xanthine phosphoribosyltransferase